MTDADRARIAALLTSAQDTLARIDANTKARAAQPLPVVYREICTYARMGRYWGVSAQGRAA